MNNVHNYHLPDQLKRVAQLYGYPRERLLGLGVRVGCEVSRVLSGVDGYLVTPCRGDPPQGAPTGLGLHRGHGAGGVAGGGGRGGDQHHLQQEEQAWGDQLCWMKV